MTFEQGCRDDAKCGEEDREREHPRHPGIDLIVQQRVDHKRPRQKYDHPANQHEQQLAGKNRPQVAAFRLAATLDQAGLQPHIRKLLDQAGKRGDRDDDAKVRRRQQTEEGDAARK